MCRGSLSIMQYKIELNTYLSSLHHLSDESCRQPGPILDAYTYRARYKEQYYLKIEKKKKSQRKAETLPLSFAVINAGAVGGSGRPDRPLPFVQIPAYPLPPPPRESGRPHVAVPTLTSPECSFTFRV